LPTEVLERGLPVLLKIEAGLEEQFWKVRKDLPDRETHIDGFETYGIGGYHYAFKNILVNCGIDQRDDNTNTALQSAGTSPSEV
jgi:hypothetical protein